MVGAANEENITQGWTPTPNGRGTWDIITSCIFTIILCCWTSICPNIPAKSDGLWWRFRDKLSLACIGLIGPEFLLLLAVGQWTSARRSVKKFHDAGYASWTMNHAFFADMGGFLLQAPGFAEFPLDAKQLYYLIEARAIRYPEINKEEIEDKNKADGLARFVTICQAIWFTLNSIARPIQHLPLTTLELTALSYIIVFFAISFCWLHKPMGVSQAVTLHTESDLAVILQMAGHRNQEPWARTPLDFVSREEYFASLFWRYYTQILSDLGIPLFSFPRPYNRIPSDNFPPTDLVAECLSGPFITTFLCFFLIGWNFSFPSQTELLLWRAAALYNLGFGVIGGGYSILCHYVLLPRVWQQKSLPVSVKTVPQSRRIKDQIGRLAARLKNNSPNRDPNLDIPLIALIPVSILSACYCICRAFILVEDFIGLRSLPAGVFDSVNWSAYIPHF